ncbi:MAG TPA: PDDEXK nuclease domain-containing protein [Alphaproteobacteria bacterium]|nr:PDDEXK nuclease domain-containing protein [Alphaproteobacteria bacterium]
MKEKLPTKHQGYIEPLKDSLDSLYVRVSGHIDSARQNVQRTVDTEMLKAYWKIGRDVVEAEQHGEVRAQYGQALIQALSQRLTNRYGKGFSETNVRNMRQFYSEYQPNSEHYPIRYTLCSESLCPEFTPCLGWSHYRLLMRVGRSEARAFYEIEASKNNWSVRELERQIGSLLFDRLAKSRDKKGVMELAYKGQELNQPEDAIKEPLVLEFLGIPESHRLVESKLEEALISNLQKFLLELGKGFAFIARQKRLTLENDHFYADLVFYHVILKCYVIIDIKTKKLSHADLGQIQLYVNYFDQEIKAENDNPTIGLVLCTDKNDAMVRYTLGEKAKQIFASKYQFHLPTEEELTVELKREIKEIKERLHEEE